MAKPEPLDKNFTLFPKLPIELRLRIWKEAAANSNPRIIEISFGQESHQCISPTLAPSILHACTESRNETLKHGHYKKLNFRNPVTLKEIFTGTYMNWAKDTIYLSYPANFDYGESREVSDDRLRNEHFELMSKCQRLALSSDWFFKYRNSEALKNMRDFTNLEELIIVIEKQEVRTIKEQLVFVPRVDFNKFDLHNLHWSDISQLSSQEGVVLRECAKLLRATGPRFRIHPLMDVIRGEDRLLTVDKKLEHARTELRMAKKEIHELRVRNAKLQAINVA